MIEQYLQVAIEFLKEIWFQLDSTFGIGESQTFQFIKPYLLKLQNNPTYLGVAFASLFLIPFGLYKTRSNDREQDRKLEELIDEMESEEVEEEESTSPTFDDDDDEDEEEEEEEAEPEPEPPKKKKKKVVRRKKSSD